MKEFALRAVIVVVMASGTLGCAGSRTNVQSTATPLRYVVDLNDRSGDTFKVTLYVDDLGPENAVYQFASTAPGTYQIMNIGRFVRSFVALDPAGGEIPSEQVTTNQWRISDPERVAEIRYSLAETWDTPVVENPIYMMCGTSIEDDHVQINGQAVFGYPTGMQSRSLRVRLDRPESWIVGTALTTDATGWYVADDYDHIVDSPILAGRLTSASLDVRGSDVEIYTYSKTGAVTSDQILESVEQILNASGRFLGELPVDRYAFLFHFEDVTMGAWEHSYSSTYTFDERAFDQLITSAIPNIVAHEFLHIVTPLNIHSDVIEQFNFVEPTPSRHVWLYEGTTEWMAHASQLRGGLITLDEYLTRLSGKLEANDNFDKSFSLTEIGLQSYSTKGQREWGNIYQRGALVAALLDIQLLSLSDGKRGLREVILDLSKKYGPDSAFDEDAFFDEFTEMTYPEIRPFIDDF
ncbi:MAG TPA: hypothetical protein VMO47_08765, partial [Rhodothermales bacterium]|nr:hypothetical protein [Rhodothermales bacterium]